MQLCRRRWRRKKMKASVSTSAPVISFVGFLFSFPLIRFPLCFTSSSFAGVASFLRHQWNALFPCPIVLSLLSTHLQTTPQTQPSKLSFISPQTLGLAPQLADFFFFSFKTLAATLSILQTKPQPLEAFRFFTPP